MEPRAGTHGRARGAHRSDIQLMPNAGWPFSLLSSATRVWLTLKSECRACVA